MSTGLTEQRWRQIRDTYQQWWAGELDRPLVQVVFTGCDPGRDEPELPSQYFTSFYDLPVPAERIVDRWEYDLACCKYAGGAFPYIRPSFGPGVIAAFLGAELINGDDTVWFKPRSDCSIADIHFEYGKGCPWLDRIKDVYSAAAKRWGGSVQLGMTDLGGNLDILSTFRPSEELLLDLYDAPDEVKRLTWEAHDCWFKYYQEIDKIIRPTNPGYSAWAGIYSAEPFYMLQCDFSYMIGPNMFDEFVKPELVEACRRLGNSFYHLDGPGALAHLDSLLSIEELGGIQWVPGAGQAPMIEWVDVYRKIQEAGKLLQVINAGRFDLSFDELDELIEKLGSGKGIIVRVEAPISQEEEILKRLERYGLA